MSEQKMTRRQVYAFVALADLPPLEGIGFVNNDGLHLDPGDNVDPGPWIRLMGGDSTVLVDRRPYDNDEYDMHGFLVIADFTWAGWRVHLQTFHKNVPHRVDSVLDEQTVEQLQAIAAGEDLVDQALAPPIGEGPLTVIAAGDVDEPRCPTCGEPERLLASGAVGHCGDERGNPCLGEVDPADEAEAVREAGDESRFLHEHGLVDEAVDGG